jgi:hypothetical protein
MRLQLYAKIDDPKLLKKSIHERGSVFFHTDNEGNIVKVVYFSGLRVVEYNGNVDEKLAMLIRAEGFAVDLLEVDEFQDSIRIVQGKQTE